MKTKLNLLLAGMFLAATSSASAATRYVWQSGPSPTPPYTNWATAAVTIQQAVDTAAPGDEIVVTNGIYATGGRTVGTNLLVNRVAVDKPLTLRSVNGPTNTIVQGYQVPGTTNGDGAIRCVYLADGASLSGFTLTNGATRAVYDYGTGGESGGGGLWCKSLTGVVSNCILTGNSAQFGGGVVGGTLNNCTLTGNSARDWNGGGACGSTLNHCTLTGNSASDWGGGASYSTLNNCTLTGNSAGWEGGGAYDGTLNNCTLTGNSAYYEGGGADGSTLNNCTLTGNSANYGGGVDLSTVNNCTLTGNSASYGGGVDESTLRNCIVYFNTCSIAGANYYTEYSITLDYCCTIPLPESWQGVGNISLDPQLASASHLSAASPCRGAGSADYASGTDIDGEAWANPPSIGCDEFHAGTATGPLSVAIAAAFTNVVTGYPVELTAIIQGRTTASVWEFGDGVATTNQPYTSHAWTTPGDYAVVLRAYNESLAGGVSATVTVQVAVQEVHYVMTDSANPLPPYTSWDTAATNIQDAVDAATVPGALVLVSNGIYAAGGRAVYGTMTNRVAVGKPLTVRSVNGPECTVVQGYQVPGTTNGDGAIRCVYLASGASLSGFTLTNGGTRAMDDGPTCRESGGGGLWCESMAAMVSNCVLVGNSAGNGGGASGGTLNDCTLTSNSATGVYGSGGGAYWGTLNNCTLTGNSAGYGGGGVCSGTLNNCIVYFNTAPIGANYWGDFLLNYCCTTPMLTDGVGNITNAPLFVDYAGGDLRLQSNSPCINAGNNAYEPGPTDLDGLPRIVSGTVDIGAYEFQGPGSVISYAWLQQYNLPTDGSADSADPDGDGHNNWQEWICGTDPTNALSVLRMLSAMPTPTNATVTWQSVAGVNYFLEQSANLAAPFTLLATNIVGQASTTSYADTNATGAGPVFYRVAVKSP